MEDMQVSARICHKRDTAAAWAAVNPVLLCGELGLETDTGRVKYGDGSRPWNTLRYFGAAQVEADPAGSADGVRAELAGKADLVDGNVSVAQIPDTYATYVEPWKNLPLAIEIQREGYIAQPSFTGYTTVTGNPSPGNPATFVPVLDPVFTNTVNGTGKSVTVQGSYYSLSDGIADDYDGSTGQITRRVERLELDGTEAWSLYREASGRSVFKLDLAKRSATGVGPICTHYPFNSLAWDVSVPETDVFYVSAGTNWVLYIKVQTVTLVDFKAMVAAQKTAGKPIIVLYGLKYPERIGVYYDLPCMQGNNYFTATITNASIRIADQRAVAFADRAVTSEVLTGINKQWLENLAALEVAVTSSEPLKLLNGWTLYRDTYSISVTKSGKLINIAGIIQGGVNTANTLLANIPVGYRPKSSYLYAVAQGLILIAPDGRLFINKPIDTVFTCIDLSYTSE